MAIIHDAAAIARRYIADCAVVTRRAEAAAKDCKGCGAMVQVRIVSNGWMTQDSPEGMTLTEYPCVSCGYVTTYGGRNGNPAPKQEEH